MIADTNVRLTPDWILDLVRESLGGQIGIDPYTEEYNPTGAAVWYTAKDPAPDALPRGTCYANPPWGAGKLRPAVLKVLGRPGTDPTMLLTPCDPRTKWFHLAALFAEYLIILTKPVKCWAPEKQAFVEPSRGAYLWTRQVPRRWLNNFVADGHLVLDLAQNKLA